VTQALYLLMAISIGFGSALQTGMVASIARARGPMEAAWVSLLASLCGLALVFGIRALRHHPPELPPPFENALIFVAILFAALVALTLSIRGVSPYLAVAGVFGFAYLFSAAFLAPRIGIALFASAVTAGTLFGSVGLDHIGAFGADIQRLSFLRVVGLAALIGGVLLVRTSR
jgi:uncharacterized membrane protein YdcZ (DUF606 family)